MPKRGHCHKVLKWTESKTTLNRYGATYCRKPAIKQTTLFQVYIADKRYWIPYTYKTCRAHGIEAMRKHEEQKAEIIKSGGKFIRLDKDGTIIGISSDYKEVSRCI